MFATARRIQPALVKVTPCAPNYGAVKNLVSRPSVKSFLLRILDLALRYYLNPFFVVFSVYAGDILGYSDAGPLTAGVIV